MRVISGRFRGRNLRTAKGVRPTLERVRKSLFDIIGRQVTGSSVLDLFAGSGTLGIEALSRGALSVLFVDDDPRSVRTLVRNLADLGEIEDPGEMGKEDRDIGSHASRNRISRSWRGNRAEVWKLGYRKAAKQLNSEGRTFDLILMDPPYRKAGLLFDALLFAVEMGMIAVDGLVVAESESDFQTPEIEGLDRIDERVYGDTKLNFWMNRVL